MSKPDEPKPGDLVYMDGDLLGTVVSDTSMYNTITTFTKADGSGDTDYFIWWFARENAINKLIDWETPDES